MLSHADNTEDPAPQSQPQAAPPSALRTQRLSPDEARAVIDLWQAELVEQTGLTDRPAVPDVAEGLDLSVEDVQRLLAEVRTRREAESRLLAQEQELVEIRLAEEQRKFAEIQRQRAELKRAIIPEGHTETTAEKATDSGSPIGLIVAAIFLIFWLWWAFSVVGIQNAVVPHSDPAPSSCGPGMYPIPGHDASFGCTSIPPERWSDKK